MVAAAAPAASGGRVTKLRSLSGDYQSIEACAGAGRPTQTPRDRGAGARVEGVKLVTCVCRQKLVQKTSRGSDGMAGASAKDNSLSPHRLHLLCSVCRFGSW